MTQAFKNRKVLLYGALGLMLVVYFGGGVLDSILNAPFEERHRRIERLERDIRDREERLTEARKTARQVDVWDEQALPADVEVARSLYQAWLLELVGNVGLTNPNVDSGEPANRKGLYSLLTFSVRGRGSMTALTELLYEFYRAPHLHQIRTINLTPVGDEGQLDIALSLEAISLPKGSRRDALAEGFSDRLVFESLEPYLVIPQRNIFGTGGGFDPTEHAVLTAVLSVDGAPQAWFTLRQTDELRKLNPGDKLRVGRLEAQVVRIENSDVLLSARGEYWLMTIGDSLAEAVAIPSELVFDRAPAEIVSRP